MNKDLLIKKYKKGTLSEEENIQLEQFISEGGIELQELEGHDVLFETLDVPPNWSSSAMDESFQEFLKRQEPTPQKKLKTSWRNPFLFALIICGAFAGGYFLQNRNTTTIEDFGRKPAQQFASADLTETLLNTNNVADKINLVSSTQITEETDEKVIQALLFALNNDPSSNVRLACIEALYAFANLPHVRQGFIRAISAQTSPIVLSQLAEAINAGGQLSEKEFRDKLNKDLPDPLLESMESSFLNLY